MEWMGGIITYHKTGQNWRWNIIRTAWIIIIQSHLLLFTWWRRHCDGRWWVDGSETSMIEKPIHLWHESKADADEQQSDKSTIYVTLNSTICVTLNSIVHEPFFTETHIIDVKTQIAARFDANHLRNLKESSYTLLVMAWALAPLGLQLIECSSSHPKAQALRSGDTSISDITHAFVGLFNAATMATNGMWWHRWGKWGTIGLSLTQPNWRPLRYLQSMLSISALNPMTRCLLQSYSFWENCHCSITSIESKMHDEKPNNKKMKTNINWNWKFLQIISRIAITKFLIS